MSKRGAIVLIVLSLFVFAMGGCFFLMFNADVRQAQQRERDWLTFTMEHRCHVAHEARFFDAATLWECDGGFQVRRYPN